MLFMVMHKVTEAMEAGGKPDSKLIAEMGKLIGETIALGQLHNGAGLKRSAERIRLRSSGGACTLTPGPLRGENELVAGFTMIEVKSMDEAIAWTKRIAGAIGDVEIELGPVTERWDLGLMEKPADAPLRALVLRKADAATEADEPLPPEKAAKLAALANEMQAAGVLLAAEQLKSSARGARLRASGGKHSWVDGPFAESKELIAGFTILKVGTLEEAKAWTDRYATILGDIEVDVREVQ